MYKKNENWNVSCIWKVDSLNTKKKKGKKKNAFYFKIWLKFVKTGRECLLEGHSFLSHTIIALKFVVI